MKKLMAVLVFTLGTAAFAQQDDANKNKNTQAMEEQKRNEGRQIGTGIDATEVDKGVKDAVGTAKDAVGIDSAKDGTFKKDKAFTMNGTLKGAAFDGITLARQGLPDADLDVRKETQVMLDGKKVELNAIPEGAQVRARFQLEGEEIVAVELNATTPKGGAKKGNK
jgi:hypothetical protein